MFYVYEWFIKDTNEIIYVGKGSEHPSWQGQRHLAQAHSRETQPYPRDRAFLRCLFGNGRHRNYEGVFQIAQKKAEH